MPNKEETKRKFTWDWRIVLAVSSVVIILLAVLLIVGSATSNPLEGEWYSKDKGYRLEVDDDKELTLEFAINEVYAEVELPYTLDKDDKIFQIKPDPAAYAEASEETDTQLSAQQIDEYLTEILMSFNYSVEKDTLTLTDREYGEQFIFTRVE